MIADPEELATWLSEVANDPVAFVEGAFAWGEGELAHSKGPEPWLRWLLEQIRDGLMTPGAAVRIALASGHGTGKSAVCSWITLWAVSTFPDSRGLITASSESMLMTRFRAELRTWFRRFKAQEFFELTATSLISRDVAHEQTWRVDLLAWNENRPEAFAGLHNKGRRILVIFDEASAIANSIWETVEAVATDADAQVIWLVAGNPLHPTGRQALKEELTGPEYTFSRTSDAILLEPKDAMKRRGVPSPDLADALACTFGGEIATLPALSDWVQPQGAISEYDPFSRAAMEGRYADAAVGGRPRYYAPPQDGWVEWPRLKPEYE
jgi:hypothetical protein